jgi:hypothetical protein
MGRSLLRVKSSLKSWRLELSVTPEKPPCESRRGRAAYGSVATIIVIALPLAYPSV